MEIRKTENTEFIGQIIDYSDSATQVVRKIAIDDLALERIDFIKIDIEGMEVEALRGADESIKRFHPILLVEKIKSNEEEILDILKLHRYKIYYLGINLLAIHEFDPAVGQISL